MIRKLSMAAALVAMTALAACATTEGAAGPSAAAAPAPGPSPTMVAMGKDVFDNVCSRCHGPDGFAPKQAVLAQHSADDILMIVTTGKMMRQASGLSDEQKRAVATYLTGSEPS